MRISIDLVANTASFVTDIQRVRRATERELRAAEREARARTQAIQSAITNIFAPLAGAVSIRAFTQLADQFDNLSARLRLATRSGEDFSITQARLFDLSQRTSAAFGGTVDLYARLSSATRDLNISQDRLLGVTETINQAVQLVNNGAESAQAALIQFGQGLASGTLRGEELNSVIEQTPRLAQALADGLGVGIGELRKLASEGKVTSEAIIAAIESQRDVLAGEFSQLPNTVGRAFTRLNNVLLLTVGEINKASGVTAQFADVLNGLASAIEGGGLRAAITSAAEAVAFLVRNLDALAIYFVGRLALPVLFGALSAAAATLGTTLAAASISAGIFGAASGAAAVGATALAAASRGLTAAMALLGGPAGVIALAAAGIYLFVTAETDAEKKTRELSEATKVYNGDAKIVGDQAIKNAQALYQQLAAELELQKALQRGRGNREDAAREIARIESELSQLAVKITEAEFGSVEFTAPSARVTPATTPPVVKPRPEVEQAIQQIEDWREANRSAIQSLTDLQTSLRDEAATFGLSEQAVLEYRLTVGDLADDVANAGAQGEKLKASILAQAEAFRVVKKAADDAANAAQREFDLENRRTAFERELSGIGAGPQQRRFNAGVQNIQDEVTGQRQRLDLGRIQGQISPEVYQQQLQALNQFQNQATADWEQYFSDLEARNADFTLAINDALLTYIDSIRNVGDELGSTLVGALQSATDATANLAAETLLWGGGGVEAAKAIARSLITETVAGFAKAGIQAALFYTLNKAGIISTTAVSTAAQTTTAATATATNATIAATAAPAAALTSLASFGSNAVPAALGIALVAGAIGALIGGAFADGGPVKGPGTGTSDSILARLSNGEFVMKASAVNRLGVDYLTALNNGMPAFADGGMVGVPKMQRMSEVIGSRVQNEVRVAVVDSDKAAEEFAASSRFDTYVIRAMQRNRGALNLSGVRF